ncbi:two-component system sensor histidine kinase YesM [Aequitasia blattaphilus]|uniref:Histidine kinase n=1 Tax=Aequitasia blattaphilus TaxID=2949332 RepID=A0ABT1E6P0_9FIRM|nr:histidine kinase [Aequitasia blattaphilus]MCP1101502.1 histidine kinase [Aequitasia blattaphilus]MCR8614142.1 histidine kinase [Aequitasia blattaphilus]
MKKIFRFVKGTFRGKLILCFVLCAVIPILTIGFTSYSVSVKIAKDKLLESTSLSSQQVARAITERMQQTENMADSVHFNLYALNQVPKEPLYQYLGQFSTVRNNITSLANAFDVYHISIFVPSDNFVSQEGLNFLSFHDLNKYFVSKENFIGIGASPKWIYQNNISFPVTVTKGNLPSGILTCYRSTQNSSGEFDYIFGIHITSKELSSILQNSYTNSDINSFLLDENGTVIAARDEAQIGFTLSKERVDNYRSHLNDFSFSTNSNEVLVDEVYSNYTLITEIPDFYIKHNTEILVNIILVSLIVIVLITILVIMYVSGSLTKRINQLSVVMENTKYDQIPEQNILPFSPPAKEEDFDEIDKLSKNFGQMLQVLDESFKDVLDLSIKEERLNYSLLQSQINPHFLYNILGSIRTLLSLNKLEEADQMLYDLSKFYRGLLKKTNELIPIKDELEIATLYMNMEALCKNNAFDWEIHMDDGIENFLICKFTLQPILENSIQHGISSINDKMHIQLSISYKEDMISIRITDNGSGIAPDILADIQKDLSEKNIRYDKHFGINNINTRISSSIQEYGTVNIQSVLGKGTTVHILIPQILEN